jgi:DNA-binding transcriptional LysR family regulator
MDMQLQQLRYVVAVAETRNFTRAAELVHVAQPSLSKQVRALERELGAALFSRARGNITLTPAGETLLPLARRVIADVDTARVQVHEVAGLGRGRLRLGATPSLATVLVPETLRLFRAAHPGIDLYVEEGGSRDLVRLLAEGVLDLALIILPLHAGDPSLATRPILEEPLAVAASAHESRLRRASIKVSELQDHPLVMFRRGYDVRDATVAALRRAGVEPTYAVEGGEMDAVLRFVEAGLGIAVVPSMVLDRRPELRRIPFAPPGISRTVALAHRRDVDLTASARVFASTLVRQLVDAERAKALPKGAMLLATGADPAWS